MPKSPNRKLARRCEGEAEEGARVPAEDDEEIPDRRMNRIGRRTIMCTLLIAALAIVWNLLGSR
jgi:hypothetical protein